ncbi:hypothetical protein IW140_002456 [Coemansia sp. RSA 1813]|nr:hypothetical protein EV178_000957 [Coemansia sp. RSA 1646]KAJ1773060.1 hypothetical protein LPJ74_001011 [Coemansia sp. RSA 1843]KAJ2092164.1 hypothetical protein IW138_001231 [Coemansia sp. RSA 986]KAJ2215300.1 hypothetical protein EV179_002248 [Coemansia sp. RSA 487]KAJ2570363.1 hypothetical protein IW140_002456 [Coemansia sp. RSA 1813]
MVARAQDIPHVDYVAQLTRHLASVPVSRSDWQKRGSVAIIIRLVIPENESKRPSAFDISSYGSDKTPASLVQTIHRFLDAPELKNAHMQMLFIQRAKYPGDPWSGHIGFPGGKREPTDGSDEVTAERETKEELGLNLSDMRNFVHLGRLDDTCAYSLFTKIILAVSAQVYLQIGERTPEMTLSAEIASVHWIDFNQVLKRVDKPVIPFTPEYRFIPVDMASRMFPKHRQSQPLWYRGFQCLFRKFYYTVLPLEYTDANSIIRTAQQVHVPGVLETARLPVPSSRTSDLADLSWKYGNTQFSSDTELYLWGLSLCILCNFVDLSLPVSPSVLHSAYTSVASPWPQMDRLLWGDVNFMINTAHRFVWGPYCRKPLHIRMQKVDKSRVVGNNMDYFQAHFITLRAAFVVSCIFKTWIIWISGKSIVGLVQKALKWISL